VVLLLFVIGLELQPSRLRAMRGAIFGLGFAQVTATTAVFTALAYALGQPLNAAFVVGFALSLSSTPLVLQLLAERGKLNTHHGRSSFAILLFQDIAVMPMLAVLPLLAARADAATPSLTGFVLPLAVLAAIVFGGPYILRPLLRFVAETRVNEAFTAAALLVVIGTALLVNSVGLSMALGAFVAGVLLADSEYRHELEADIEPFKGLLLGLFFIAVGMAANVGLLLQRPLQILGLVAGLIAVKMAILWLLARFTRHAHDDARGMAFALPQAGEFGFVLFSLAVARGVLDPSLAEVLVIVVTLSMMASPLLMTVHARVIEPRRHKRPVREFDKIDAQDSRVIIAGIGRFGQIVSRILRMRRISFTAIDVSIEQIDLVRRFGNKAYYGDVARLELLQTAGVARAELFVLAIDDVEASVRTAELLRGHFPQVKILARARNRQHALHLMDLGVRYIVRETYYSGVELARHALETLGFSREQTHETVERFHQLDRQLLQTQKDVRQDEEKLIQTSKQAALELERILESDEEAERTGA
jgi:glutathione-regulated potassium-efflux system ancillary protein KefC/glutathione-regulated potassium-efflux system protein KefB